MPPTIEFSKRYASPARHKAIQTGNVNKTSFLSQTPVVKPAVAVVVGVFLGGCNATVPIESDAVYCPGNPNPQSAQWTCRSEEHTSESSHITISYAVFCLKKKTKRKRRRRRKHKKKKQKKITEIASCHINT